MAENFDPTVQQNFPTSAKPVFIRLGLLIVGLLAIVLWLYLDAHSGEEQKLPTKQREKVEGIINQPHESDMRLSD